MAFEMEPVVCAFEDNPTSSVDLCHLWCQIQVCYFQIQIILLMKQNLERKCTANVSPFSFFSPSLFWEGYKKEKGLYICCTFSFQIRFHHLKGHSRSIKTTFLFKNPLFSFVLFVLLIDWRKKCRWKLWKSKTTFALYIDDICLIQRRHRILYYSVLCI